MCCAHVHACTCCGVGEMSFFVNIGPAAGVCLHWLCIESSLSLDRRPWISEAQYSSFIKWDDAILLSLRLFCCLQLHHGWLSCLLATAVSSYLGGLGVGSIVTCQNLLLVDGTRSLESNEGPRETGSLRRWWPGGLPWPVGTVDPIVILWSLVLVGHFISEAKWSSDSTQAGWKSLERQGHG